MPQIILEYSNNIKDPGNLKDLLLKCHRILESIGGIRISNCKSRAIRRDLFLVGDGTNPHDAFVHFDLAFAAERGLDIKQRIGKEILKVLEDHFPKSKDLQITVKITTIDKETYFKIPEGTFSPPI